MRFLSRFASERPRAKNPRRTRHIKLAFAVAGVAILAGAAGGGAWFVKSGRADAAFAAVGARLAEAGARIGFRIETVAVEGRDHESRDALLGALGVKRGAPILAVDLGAARTRIEALPWVRTAEVERLLPGRLFIRLQERHPLAFWQREGRLELIADDGTVIPDAHLADYGALVVLVGEDAPKLGAPFLALLATEPLLMPHVAAAVRVGGRRWNVRLDSGIDVDLPEEDPEGAWHRLAALERSDSLLDRQILAVDLRLPDRLVVRLPEAPKPAPKKTKLGGKPT
jgi:cell division protein FtsQ